MGYRLIDTPMVPTAKLLSGLEKLLSHLYRRLVDKLNYLQWLDLTFFSYECCSSLYELSL